MGYCIRWTGESVGAIVIPYVRTKHVKYHDRSHSFDCRHRTKISIWILTETVHARPTPSTYSNIKMLTYIPQKPKISQIKISNVGFLACDFDGYISSPVESTIYMIIWHHIRTLCLIYKNAEVDFSCVWLNETTTTTINPHFCPAQWWQWPMMACGMAMDGVVGHRQRQQHIFLHTKRIFRYFPWLLFVLNRKRKHRFIRNEMAWSYRQKH